MAETTAGLVTLRDGGITVNGRTYQLKFIGCVDYMFTVAVSQSKNNFMILT